MCTLYGAWTKAARLTLSLPSSMYSWAWCGKPVMNEFLGLVRQASHECVATGVKVAHRLGGRLLYLVRLSSAPRPGHFLLGRGGHMSCCLTLYPEYLVSPSLTSPAPIPTSQIEEAVLSNPVLLSPLKHLPCP